MTRRKYPNVTMESRTPWGKALLVNANEGVWFGFFAGPNRQVGFMDPELGSETQAKVVFGSVVGMINRDAGLHDDCEIIYSSPCPPAIRKQFPKIVASLFEEEKPKAKRKRRVSMTADEARREIRRLRDVNADLSRELETERRRSSELDDRIRTLELDLHQARQRAAVAEDREERPETTVVRTEIVETSGLDAVRDALATLPTDLEGQLELVRALWPERIALTDEARSSSEGHAGCWQLLYTLPTVLWPLYFEKSSDIRREYQDRTGFELALVERKLTRANAGAMAERDVDYDGRVVRCEAHVKGPDGLRVYLCNDNETRKVVIGHVGDHLTTAGTRYVSSR